MMATHHGCVDLKIGEDLIEELIREVNLRRKVDNRSGILVLATCDNQQLLTNVCMTM